MKSMGTYTNFRNVVGRKAMQRKDMAREMVPVVGQSTIGKKANAERMAGIEKKVNATNRASPDETVSVELNTIVAARKTAVQIMTV